MLIAGINLLYVLPSLFFGKDSIIIKSGTYVSL